ncbi:hypothetical protein M1446_04205 [Candidatus Dependentiae bacterium]|nr:hypothetical protein [Candidatus Dependentiae bacterium]
MKNLKFSLLTAIIVPLMVNAVVFENQTGEIIAVRIKEANDNIIKDITHLDAKSGILSTTKIDIGDARKYKLPFKIRIWLKKQFESSKKGEKGKKGHGLLFPLGSDEEESLRKQEDLRNDERIYFDILNKKGSAYLVKIIYDGKSDRFYVVPKVGPEVKEYKEDVEPYLKLEQKEKEKRFTVQPVKREKSKEEYANVPRGSVYHVTPEYVQEKSYAKTPVGIEGKKEVTETEYANVPVKTRPRSEAVTQKPSEQTKSVRLEFFKPQDLP